MGDVLSKVSGMTFYGYWDPSKSMVTVHFFGSEERPDIIAYLQKDMSWDVREIIAESSTLKNDHEEVIISHRVLEPAQHNDEFDKFVRFGLLKMAKEIHGVDVVLSDLDVMFKVLENNSYNVVN